MAAPIFKEVRNDLFNMWSACFLDADPNRIRYVSKTCLSLLSNKARYQEVEKVTKVPWYMIGCIHFMEASFNFNTCLHNGDPLPGPTTHVPKGRGPFASWELAAVDAFVYEDMANISNWTIEYVLYKLEAYNGFGYRRRNLPSPYVWAYTNQSNEKGLFVRDHVFDYNAPHNRPGAAALLKYLESNGHVVFNREDIISEFAKPVENQEKPKLDEIPEVKKPVKKSWWSAILKFFK